MRPRKNSPKLPRFKMPPPSKAHTDEKKAASKKACRRPIDGLD